MNQFRIIPICMWLTLLAFALPVSFDQPAEAQDRGRWGRDRDDNDRGDRDRRDRDRGDRRRGDRGRDDRDRGGEDRRAQWMRSLDKNGDGRLELNEIPEQMRDRFQERAKQAGFDLNRPIPIDRYLQQRNDQERRERQGLDPNNPTAFEGVLQPGQAPEFGEPLTPEELVLLNPELRREILLERADPSVIGKGVEITQPGGGDPKVDKEQDERNEQAAKQTIERFDRDKNGVIEGDEVNPWVRNFDTNGDNKITQEEAKASIARFRAGQQEGRGENGERGGRRGDRGDRGGWRDRGDRDDRGGRGDWGRGGRGGRGNFGGGDFRGRNGDDSGQEGDRNEGRDEEDTKEEEAPRRSYRFTPAQERLSESAREWIVPKDKNANGQVEMSEFATTWNASKLREFDEWDLDGDGVITGAEVDAKGPPRRPSFRDRARGEGGSDRGEDRDRDDDED